MHEGEGWVVFSVVMWGVCFQEHGFHYRCALRNPTHLPSEAETCFFCTIRTNPMGWIKSPSL